MQNGIQPGMLPTVPSMGNHIPQSQSRTCNFTHPQQCYRDPLDRKVASSYCIANQHHTNNHPTPATTMLSSPLVPALPLAIILLLLIHFTTATTTLHFFAHTSCNADTSIGTPFTADFADGASRGSCQATPNGTVAIYIDAVDVGCSSKY